MASALQCPACGHKHRLTGLNGDPVFACEQCGRLLKTPVEYRRPEPSGPSEAPRPNGTARVERGGSATRDQTSVLRRRGAPATAASATAASTGGAARSRRSAPRPPATIGVPLQILGWVVAILLGGIIVRYLAKFTGLVTGDSLIDIITGSGWGRYLRLFALVPFWALVTAGLMTGFVEGARWWTEHRRTMPSGRAPSTAARPTPAATTAPPVARTTKQPTPPAEAPPTARPAPPEPSPAEVRSPSGAAAAPRARRIPKRDISS